MSEQVGVQSSSLTERFPEIILPDSRTGYSGFLVKPENLVVVAQALRDEMG